MSESINCGFAWSNVASCGSSSDVVGVGVVGGVGGVVGGGVFLLDITEEWSDTLGVDTFKVSERRVDVSSAGVVSFGELCFANEDILHNMKFYTTRIDVVVVAAVVFFKFNVVVARRMDVGDGFGGSFSNVGEGEYEALIVVDLDLFWIVVMMVRSCSYYNARLFQTEKLRDKK